MTAPAGLSLRFSQANLPEAKPTASAVPGAATALPNLSFSSMGQGGGRNRVLLGNQQAAVQAKEQANREKDLLRLSAYVDELTTRLKKTQHRLEQTEAQLTRTSQVLCHERQAADQTLAGYKSDLAQAHETEAKLRSELKATQKKTSLTDSSFMTSVGSALTSDEQARVQQRNLSELETKVSAMGDFKVKLEAEIAKLEGLRTQARKDLEEQRQMHEEQARAAASAIKELQSAQKQLIDVKADHSMLAEKLAAAKIEHATLSEALQALRAEKLDAEAEAESARSATRAMLLEHGDASTKLTAVQKHIEELECKKDCATKHLKATEERAAAAEKAVAEKLNICDVPAFTLDTGCAVDKPTASKDGETAGAPVSQCAKKEEDSEDEEAGAALPVAAPPPAPSKAARRRAVVSGAMPPSRELCTGMDLTKMLKNARPSAASPVASMLEFDAPIELTMQRVAFVGSMYAIIPDAPTAATGSAQKAQEDHTAQMIKAVVGDLRSKLTELSQQQPVWRPVAPLA